MVEVAPDLESYGQFGLAGCACLGGEETIVVGVWTVPAHDEDARYLAAAKGIVDRYAQVLGSGRAILAGDFNVSGRTDLEGVTAFFRAMRERFGLVSAYHTFNKLPIRTNDVATLWWLFDESKTYHCDFVFVPEAWRIANVMVGTYADWGSVNAKARSDHAPVIVDVVR